MMLLQRALLLSALVVFAVADPSKFLNLQRMKRDSEDTYYNPMRSSVSTYAGSSTGYPSYGRGFPWSYYPMFPNPFLPMWPFFNFRQPWYKGPNVCQETKYADDPQVFKDMMRGLSNDPDSYDQSEHQSCRGDEKRYVCRGVKNDNGNMRQFMTVYTCCDGYFRSIDGCIKSGDGTVKPEIKEDQSDHTDYGFIPKGGYSPNGL